MKKPIALISNDWHLKPTNTELILGIVDDMIAKAKKLEISDIFILGDVFHDRKSQRQIVLNTFKRVLDKFSSNGLDLHIVTGNHDRSDYSSNFSFLTPFNEVSDCLIFDDFDSIPIDSGEVDVMVAPFFSEDMWIENFKDFNFESNVKKVLLTHVGFQGSVNNDGSVVTSPIKPSLFKDFDLVLSGHYHNQQQVAPNIHHLPSLYQDNFGEDNKKGFTVLYDDLSFELIKSNFPEYIKVKVDIDNIPKKDLENKLIEGSKLVEEGNNVRFEFKGSEKKIKALKKDIYTSNGIDVKTKIKEIEETSVELTEEVKKLDLESINNKFTKFCDEEELELKVGQEYLNKILKN